MLRQLCNHFIKMWHDERGAIVTHGGTLPDSAEKSDFYNLVDQASVSGIIDSDISSSAAIQDSKLAEITTANKVNISALGGQIANSNLAQIVAPGLVSGASLVLLPNIPVGAGLIPVSNIGSLLGTWTTKNVGTTYQAATDLFITVYTYSGGSQGIQFFTDSNSSPTTGRINCSSNYSNGLSCFVKKGDYYVATVFSGSGGTLFMYMLPLGS